MTHNLILHPMTHPPRDTLSDPPSPDTPSDPQTHDELSDPPINQPSLSSPSPVQGSSVVVSDSPVKPDPKLWLPCTSQSIPK